MSHLWIGLFCFPPTDNWIAGRKIVWIPWNLSFHSLMAKNKLWEREGGLFRIFCWQMKINKFLLKYYFYFFFLQSQLLLSVAFQESFVLSIACQNTENFILNRWNFISRKPESFLCSWWFRSFFWICLSKFSILMIDVNRKRFSLMNKSNNVFFFKLCRYFFMNIWSILQRL